MSDAVSLGLAVGVPVALADGVVDAVGLAEGLEDGAAGEFGALPLAVADGAAFPASFEELEPDVAFGAEGAGLGLGFGLVVGGLVVGGLGVGFGVVLVGAGALVLVGAGGAMPGCCPEPNRNPTTEPGAGL